MASAAASIAAIAVGQDALDLLGGIGQLAEQQAGSGSVVSRPAAWPSSIARSVRETTWPKKLFVEATAISLLALV